MSRAIIRRPKRLLGPVGFLFLCLATFLAELGCGDKPDYEQQAVTKTIFQMRRIHNDILGAANTNPSTNVLGWVGDMARRQGVDVFRCVEDSNSWICINPDAHLFASNSASNVLIMFTPNATSSRKHSTLNLCRAARFWTTTNSTSPPTWQPVPVWQLAKSPSSPSPSVRD